ncbi:MAG: hypothetical protein J6A01_02620 [Proteobacteria bacterium]|nr:hypothetical protein [Pseudomonadota bacterium]
MQISDFLQKNLSPKAVTLLAYESGIQAHFDAYLQQIWPEGRIAIVVEQQTREYAERTLVPALNAHGFETVYCLCVKSAGTSYRAQIDESLGDGELDGVVGMAALGSNALFDAVRQRASMLDVGCCALLQELPGLDLFASCGENRPTPDAVFFDLDEISRNLRGDLREAHQSLEVDLYALKVDIATSHALGHAMPAAFLDALQEAMPPRMPQHTNPTEDELAQLCEAFAWRAVAERLCPNANSLATVREYANAASDMPAFLPVQHAQMIALILDAALELEALEISAEDCADKQPPKEILRRTLQQILLEDGLKFDWLERADENFEDRVALRHTINALAMNWDELCAKMRPIADMMHAICAQANDDEDEPDAMLKQLWLHAARFAPRNTFLKLFNNMGIVEPALYV